MRVTLEGLVVGVSHNTWEAREWNGRQQPAGEQYLLHLSTSYHRRPERVELTPAQYGKFDDPSLFGVAVRVSGDVKGTRFGQVLVADEIEAADAGAA